MNKRFFCPAKVALVALTNNRAAVPGVSTGDQQLPPQLGAGRILHGVNKLCAQDVAAGYPGELPAPMPQTQLQLQLYPHCTSLAII